MFLNITSIDRNTLRIAIPLIISNITIPLVGFVDNVMMGHLGSVIYIGAIGVGAIIISFIVNAMLALMNLRMILIQKKKKLNLLILSLYLKI